MIGQEYDSDNNVDLHQTRIWTIDDVQLYKITDTFPDQYLLVSDYKFYLTSAWQGYDDSSKVNLKYIEQSDWLRYEAGQPVVSETITDQDDANLAWTTNRKKVIEIMNEADHTKSMNYMHCVQHSSSWIGDSKDLIYETRNKKLSVIKDETKRQNVAMYKNKFFTKEYPKAHHRFEKDPYDTFFYLDKEGKGIIFKPSKNKFIKQDLRGIDGTFNAHSRYLMTSWASSNSIDLIELADEGVYLFPDFTSQNSAAKILLYENPSAHKETVDSWLSADLEDLNNDWRLDLILFGESPAVILNKSKDEVITQQLTEDRIDPSGLSCADADGDNDLDIFVDGYQGLLIFLNEGNSFKKDPIRIGSYFHPFFFLIDLDNEGDRDLLIKKRRSKMDYAEFENGEFKDEVEFLIRK